jgi:hypothetical protein
MNDPTPAPPKARCVASMFFRPSEADWKDLLFSPSSSNINLGHSSPLVIPTEAQRSGGICSAPSGSLKSLPGIDADETIQPLHHPKLVVDSMLFRPSEAY